MQNYEKNGYGKSLLISNILTIAIDLFMTLCAICCIKYECNNLLIFIFLWSSLITEMCYSLNYHFNIKYNKLYIKYVLWLKLISIITILMLLGISLNTIYLDIVKFKLIILEISLWFTLFEAYKKN